MVIELIPTAEGTAVSIGGNTNQQRDMEACERGSFGWGKVEEIIEILVPSTIPKNNSLYLAGSLRKRKLHLIRVRRFRSVNCCYSVNGSFGKHSRRLVFFGWLIPAFDHASKIVEVPPTWTSGQRFGSIAEVPETVDRIRVKYTNGYEKMGFPMVLI